MRRDRVYKALKHCHFDNRLVGRRHSMERVVVNSALECGGIKYINKKDLPCFVINIDRKIFK